MNKEKNIVQKSVHSKATRQYYKQQTVCNNSGYSNHSNSGYSNHSNGGYSNHSNGGGSCQWGIWYDQWGGCAHSNSSHSNSGCGNHSNSGCGNHSNNGGCGNHTNSSYTNTVADYLDSVDTTTWNPEATANKVVLSKAFVNNVKVPTIYMRWASGSGVEIRPDFSGFNRECTAIRFYLRTSTTKTFSNNWTLMGEVNASSSVYNWNVGTLATDTDSIYCQIGVTGYNGSWSALLSNGALTTQDKREQMTSGGTNPVITVQSWTDVAASFMLSDTFKIYFYKPPTWLTDPWQKETTDQLEEQINKARGKLDVTAYSFADRPIIENFTIVKASDIANMITATGPIASDGNQTTPSAPTASSATFVNNNAITALQSILNNLGQ